MKVLWCLLMVSVFSYSSEGIQNIHCQGTLKSGEISYDMEGNRFEEKIKVELKFSRLLVASEILITDVTKASKQRVLVKEIIKHIIGDSSISDVKKDLSTQIMIQPFEYFYTNQSFVDLSYQTEEDDNINGKWQAHLSTKETGSIILDCKKL